MSDPRPMERVAVTVVLDDETALRAALVRVSHEAPEARITELRSAAPLPEDLAALAPTRASRAPLCGIAGGLGGGAVAWLLAVLTAKAYPLVTGHMAIVAGPPVGIVVYEGIAFGAVVATALCVLVEGRLGRRRQGSADARLACGEIEITIEPPTADGARHLRRLLEGG